PPYEMAVFRAQAVLFRVWAVMSLLFSTEIVPRVLAAVPRLARADTSLHRSEAADLSVLVQVEPSTVAAVHAARVGARPLLAAPWDHVGSAGHSSGVGHQANG